MTRVPSARELVGRRIVAFDARPFPDDKGGTAHDSIITLDDGSTLEFKVEETDHGSDYGVSVKRYNVPSKRRKSPA